MPDRKIKDRKDREEDDPPPVTCFHSYVTFPKFPQSFQIAHSNRDMVNNHVSERTIQTQQLGSLEGSLSACIWLPSCVFMWWKQEDSGVSCS